jgi:hypothetical protein
MDNNIPATPPTPPTSTPQGDLPIAKNKITTPIIVIIALVVIGGGYFVYQKWQRQRVVNSFLNQLGVTDSSLFGTNINKIAEQIAKEDAEQEAQKNKSPSEKFADAEPVDIADNGHLSSAKSINNIIKTAYGDSKITGFTSGYMGMNSGSGIYQFMIPKILSMNDVIALKDQLQNNDFEIIATTQQNDSASITAQKNDSSYTFGFNSGDQEIMAIVIAVEYQNN